jgi:hypothetical protein
MIQRKFNLDVVPTPDELAFEFSQMNDEQQAMFFNELADIVGKWDGTFCFQMQFVRDNQALTQEGRNVMRQIGEYGV